MLTLLTRAAFNMLSCSNGPGRGSPRAPSECPAACAWMHTPPPSDRAYVPRHPCTPPSCLARFLPWALPRPRRWTSHCIPGMPAPLWYGPNCNGRGKADTCHIKDADISAGKTLRWLHLSRKPNKTGTRLGYASTRAQPAKRLQAHERELTADVQPRWSDAWHSSRARVFSKTLLCAARIPHAHACAPPHGVHCTLSNMV